MDEDKDEEECGDTPAGRLTHSLLMQTAQQRASANRRRQDSREYRCVRHCWIISWLFGHTYWLKTPISFLQLLMSLCLQYTGDQQPNARPCLCVNKYASFNVSLLDNLSAHPQAMEGAGEPILR